MTTTLYRFRVGERPRIVHVVSEDGVVWERSPHNPVITNQMIGTKINFVSYLRHDNKDFVYIEAGGSGGTNVMLMTSP